jgi:hypothetical protein
MMVLPEIRRPWVFALALLAPILCSDGAAWADGEECRMKSYQEKIPCYKQAFEHIIQTQGTEQALDALQQLSSVDPDVRHYSHPYTHHIGKFTFTHYKDAATAFAHCKDTFWSGCYHGVLEGFVSQFPNLAPKDIASVCSGVRDPLRPIFMKFQCVHGLGHGLTMHFQHDLFKSLTYCDALPTTWDQESCYGGAFMENVIWFQTQPHADEHGNHAEHAGPATRAKLLDPGDAHYPCNAVEKRYQRSCYMMQTSAMLTFNGYDFARTFKECEKAPAELVETCVRSLGRDVSGYTLTNAERVRTLCLLGPPHLIGQCFRGAAKDFGFTHASPQRSIALCRIVDGPYKADCYAAVQEFLVDFHADQAKRDLECKTADEAYQSICRGTLPVADERLPKKRRG